MSTCNDCSPELIPSDRAPFNLGRLAQVAADAFERVRAMRLAANQRRELLTLDDRTLRDIGVSRLDIDREAGRHFWDIDL